MTKVPRVRHQEQKEYNRQVKKIAEDEMEYTDDAEFGTLNTIDDIGYHLTERMEDSMLRARANDDIAYNSPPVIAFPGSELYGNLYKEYNDQRSEFHTDQNTPLKYRYGDPGLISKVNYDSPGLAMGEANVLNPDHQFNELDDVRSDFRRPFIGRLYSERVYDYNLPKVIFETGIMSLNTGLFGVIGALASNGSESADMSNYLRDPGNNPIKLAFTAVGAAIKGVLNFTVGGLLSGLRFYNFKPNMRIYMKFVNEMLIEVASWMDLATLPVFDLEEDYSGGEQEPDKEGTNDLETRMSKYSPSTSGPEEKIGGVDQIGEGTSAFTLQRSTGYKGIRETLSVFNILPGWRVSKNAQTSQTTIQKLGSMVTDFWQETANLSAMMFIPFGLSRGVQVSESFSNSTTSHPLAEDLKSKGTQVYQKSLMGVIGQATSAIDIGKSLFAGDYTDAIFKAGQEMLTMKAKKGRVLGEGGIIMTGEGKFQLPEIWEDSDYSRTYNLNFKFRAPYGHRLSIFENTMVQTIFFINMTAPRQIGASTYTSPFYIRAFSKGLFSVEMGLIDRLDISRGEDKNERTVEGFSKVINCSVSIKSVIPRLMVGLNAGIFGILSSKNVGFREYIAMFANVDLIDQNVILNKYKNFVNVLVNRFSGENALTDLKYNLSQTLPFKLLLKARVNFGGYKPPVPVSSVKPQSVY
jgi:hypothetical protein